MSSNINTADPTFDLVLRRARRWGKGDPADVAIKAGKIVAVEANIAARGQEDIDLNGAAIAPTFIEPHIHLDKAFTQTDGHADSLERASELSSYGVHSQEAIEERTARALTLLASHGVSTVRSHVNVGPSRGLGLIEAVLAATDALRDKIDVEIVAFADASMEPGCSDWALMSAALDLGCKALGGGTARRENPKPLVEGLCRLAADHGASVDLHIDEHLRPNCDGLEALLQETRRFGLGRRVVASHCCALGAVSDDFRMALIDMIASLEVGIIVLPMTNLFLQGRCGAPGVGPRGLAPIQELLAAGVRVTCGADNVQDPYLPYGNADPQLTLAIAGMAAQLSTGDGHEWLATAANLDAAAVLGVDNIGLEAGNGADLIVYSPPNGTSLGTAPTPLSLIIRRGRVTYRAIPASVVGWA